jgi:hypothetical protein
MKTKLLASLLLACAVLCHGQGLIVQFQNAGTPIGTFKKWLPINCSTNLTCTLTNGTIVITASSSAATAFSALTAATNSGSNTNPIPSKTEQRINKNREAILDGLDLRPTAGRS